MIEVKKGNVSTLIGKSDLDKYKSFGWEKVSEAKASAIISSKSDEAKVLAKSSRNKQVFNDDLIKGE